MPINDPPRIYDAFAELFGGVDGHMNPLQLPATRVAKAVNCSFRGGIVSTRPGFRLLPLAFEDSDTKARFERFRIQGGSYYYHPSHNGRLVAGIGGRIFSTAINGQVQDLTILNDASSVSTERMWFCQAEQYMVIQDGVNQPVILDGTESRRSDPDNEITIGSTQFPAPEVPPGKQMAFGQNRLIVASITGDSFRIGDIQGGAGTVLTFSETTYLNEAPSFSLPLSFGGIAFMAFLPQADTSVGIGPLIVAGTLGIMAYDITAPRTTWLDTDISRAIALGIGGTGQGGQCAVNGDLFFRSQQGGVRSLRMARSEQGGWGRVPVSREVANYLDMDSSRWLADCQMANFDNRLFVAAIPKSSESGRNHLAIAVLNFDMVGGISGKMPPAWEGIWTGITPTVMQVGLFDGEERMLALCHDEDGINRVYEITKDAKMDLDGTPIQAFIETRLMDFGSKFNRKELLTADLWLSNIHGQVEFVVKWRREDSGLWHEWHRFTICQGGSGCGGDGEDCSLIITDSPIAKSRVRLPRPPAVCGEEEGSTTELSHGYAFQFRIEWEGFAAINRFRVHALKEDEEQHGGCDDAGECTEIGSCPDSDFEYNLALDVLGCADATIALYEDVEYGSTLNLRPWQSATVYGATWILEGVDEYGATIPYVKGAVDGIMVGLPATVTAYHPTMQIRTYCVDPYAGEGLDFTAYGV